MGQPRPLFVYFRSFQTQFFQKNCKFISYKVLLNLVQVHFRDTRDKIVPAGNFCVEDLVEDSYTEDDDDDEEGVHHDDDAPHAQDDYNYGELNPGDYTYSGTFP